jgi:peptide/nickel transport system permease protein
VARYFIRRLLITIPVIFVVIFLVFALARLIPGDPCTQILGERATAAQCQAFAQRNGLDQPIPIQFLVYLRDVVGGDLGNSIKHAIPVTELIAQRLPTTVELAFFALIFAIGVGVPLGIASAARRNSKTDAGSMAIANLGVSTPVFVLGLLLAFLFAVVLKGTPLALPSQGRLSPGVSVKPLVEMWGLKDLQGPPRGILDFVSGIYVLTALISGQWNAAVDAFRHLLLPAIALGTIPMAIIARITRSSLLDVMGRDYIRTARAKGVAENRILIRHALRNALLPIVTIIGLQIGILLGGAVLTESVFNLSGVGRAVVEAIDGRDYAVIQGFTLIIAIGFLVINLLVDVSYAWLDPRVRLS